MASPRRIDLIGIPLDLGAGRRGVDMGPSALRIAQLGGRLAALGHTVNDRGDLRHPVRETRPTGNARKKYIRDIARVCRQLYRASDAALEAGSTPVVLGGDHSVAAGSVAATAAAARRRRRPLGLLWVDAHADMNTPSTSTSGNVHGMPLAALLGPEPAELASIGDVMPAIRPDRVALLGIRSLDAQEKALVRDSGVHLFTMSDIDRLGLATVTQRALSLIGRGRADLHVSFDLDVCDPAIAPGVGTPVRGGLSYRETHMLMELVADTGRLRALDLVEVNPTLDTHNATAELAVEFALSAFGQRIL
jgi:arginase